MTMVDRASRTKGSEKSVKKLMFQLPALAEEMCINYQAQSPDELCLCRFAQDNGVVLKDRNFPLVTIEVLGEERVYETLETMEFTSERARMSVVVRMPEGNIVLYAKGADHVMMPRVSERVSKKLVEDTLERLERYATSGMRTLVCARKELTSLEYKEIKAKVDQAKSLIEGRKEALEKVAEEVERELDLVGCTAIEDRLQRGVPETILYFMRSGIKIWIITGDKRTTAINIAKACNLLQSDMKCVIVSARSDDECAELLEEALTCIGNRLRVALIIDGESLPFAFAKEKLFLTVTKSCATVVVCRATPLQKAMMVRMIKRGTGMFTLSIGDGANDVSMIQEAHIGVGIFGQEGSQATRASDYAVYQFRHLHRLVCIHGRYNMIRIALLFLVSYYKNIAVYLSMVYFSFHSGFSAQVLFENWILAIYNLVLTSVPPLLLSIWEKDVEESIILKYPQAHCEVLMLSSFSLTYKRFLSWCFLAIWHSLLIYFIPYFFYRSHSALSSNGKMMGLPEYGTVTFIGGYLVILAQIAITTTHWNWIIHLGMWGSLFLFFVSFAVVSHLKIYEAMWHVFDRIFTSSNAFFVCFLVLMVALVPSICWSYIKENWYPGYAQRLARLERRAKREVRNRSTVKLNPD